MNYLKSYFSVLPFSCLDILILPMQTDDNVGCMVLTGGDKVFAAGADLMDMVGTEFAKNLRTDFLGSWNTIRSIGKPILAAVNGMALGGGCELAMMCDIIYAGDNAT